MDRREIDEIWEMIRETNKGLEETKKLVNRISDGWGRWVEGSVSPSAEKVFRRLGYKIITDYHRVKVYEDKRTVAEYDTLLVSEKGEDKVLFIGEAKTFFASEDVKGFLYDLENAKKWLKEFREYKIIGFIAGMNYGEGADSFAIRSGLFVFRASGEMMVLDVPKGFKLKVY